MVERKRTKGQERSYAELLGDLTDLESWLRNDKLKQRMIPREWKRIEREVPLRARKTKLTARFDTDMVKWFSGLGMGYQARMNAVLRCFMLAVVSKEIESRGDRDWKGDPL